MKRTRAGRAPSTITRLPSCTASATSWVTKTTVLWVMPTSRRSGLESLARLDIQRAKGLVHEQDTGLKGKRPRQRHPLAHST